MIFWRHFALSALLRLALGRYAASAWACCARLRLCAYRSPAPIARYRLYHGRKETPNLSCAFYYYDKYGVQLQARKFFRSTRYNQDRMFPLVLDTY